MTVSKPAGRVWSDVNDSRVDVNHSNENDSAENDSHVGENDSNGNQLDENSGRFAYPLTATIEETSEGKFTSILMVGALVSVISSLLYGYDTGIISGALLQIRAQFQMDDQTTEMVTSAILAGAIIGALAGSKLSERFGRRRTVMMLSLVFVVGSLASALAPAALELAIARVILGFAVGGATQTVPMYIAELAPSNHRGRLVLTFQIGIGAGIVIATIVGAAQSISWRIAIGCAALPALLMLAMAWRLPESPRWLVEQGRHVEVARAVLQRLRGQSASVDSELAGIVAIDDEQRQAARHESGWRGLRRPWVRPALVVGCGIAIFTQLSGIEMIVYYAPTILTSNGFNHSTALQVSVGLGVTYLIMMIAGLSVVDVVGRRRLTLMMVPGAAISLFVLGGLFVTGHSDRDDVPFIVTCLIVFMFFNAGGLQLMAWLTGSEIYPLSVRGAGTSAQAVTLWTTNLFITLTLLTLINAVGVGQTMWLYGLFNVLAWIFVLVKMPDLTGRSLEDIEQKLRSGHFCPADFQRPSHSEPTA
ncbi:sugar porter family MFS transporter [Mycobacterium montefiorense]|uniref:MFS transporter n=1 Tax=Mycobacterium montefiorense TaxID=154654 RepID=A0AA37UUI1_9MYCO|nr:sugar porter family MFS transporter [Mycobacterium montefiorense]GBG38533.1 MFS transporter [Mycobacterium montefiorense]GKU34361.1 MFS transporter [Mycobacterium montefiorense]GKU38982.1 MFS transporter [Mycobacterium montefiorense]GKU47980.1 MFS transporter [Mycobacterium montefiorense]GKU49747.1 MFS transporter [Mycobacterium montefiorense]